MLSAGSWSLWRFYGTIILDSQLLGAAGSPWLSLTYRCMLRLSASVLTWHSLCVCVQVCPLLGRTLVIRLGPVPIQCDLNLITSAKSLLPSKMTIIGMEGQNLTMSLWWGARWNPQHTLSSPDVPRLLLQSFLLTTYEHPLFSSFFFPM